MNYKKNYLKIGKIRRRTNLIIAETWQNIDSVGKILLLGHNLPSKICKKNYTFSLKIIHIAQNCREIQNII